MSQANLKRKLDSFDESNSILPSRSQFLNEKLSHRPDRHQLVQQGILHDSQCAPSLQNAECALKRARLADGLKNHLVNRPGPLDLIKHKILHIDTGEHPNLEEAIQGGQIPFKTTKSSSRRSLIFHEYTGPPSSCKPKVTKMESLSSSSNTHQIRLAQQELLLELTSEKANEEEQSSNKPLEQMTRIELRDLCKQYQIPSSHTNKTTLIERIKQTQHRITNQEPLTNSTECSTLEMNWNEMSNGEIISSLRIPPIDEEEEEIEPFSTSELDEILQSFPLNFLSQEENEDQRSSLSIDLDLSTHSIDPSTMTSDDLFIQMLLDNDYSSLPPTTTETTFEHFLFSDPSTSVPRITSVDEFEAFLSDFTRNLSSHQQEVSTPIS